jgi:hypothetical protein
MRALIARIAVVVAALVGTQAAVAADTMPSRTAAFGTGTLSVSGVASGRGRAAAALWSLPRSQLLSVTFRRGACAKPGTTIVGLTAKRSTASPVLPRGW